LAKTAGSTAERFYDVATVSMSCGWLQIIVRLFIFHQTVNSR